MKRGFTLVEVCVAALVLAFASSALLRFVSGYAQVSKRERDYVQSFVKASAKLEHYIEFPPACSDTLVRDSLNVLSSMERTAREGLLWLSVKSGTVELNRMVKCNE
ncbi:MAG: type II secretion system GspH family protein [Fibrobacter sp.]|uniref:type II secretion system protein n=1 Tax=Fibrobacter sp. TaxID=35828 RepID=UPI00388F4078|nr:type II secretion system GspH family protein [Fibrobacter sp.]